MNSIKNIHTTLLKVIKTKYVHLSKKINVDKANEINKITKVIQTVLWILVIPIIFTLLTSLTGAGIIPVVVYTAVFWTLISVAIITVLLQMFIQPLRK